MAERNRRAWLRTSRGFDSHLVSHISCPTFVCLQMIGYLWGSLGMKKNCGLKKISSWIISFWKFGLLNYKLLSSGEFNPSMCRVCGTLRSCFVELDRSDSLNCKFNYLVSKFNVKFIFIFTNIKWLKLYDCKFIFCSVCTRHKFHVPTLVDT